MTEWTTEEVLQAGHPQMAEGVLYIDFDAVLYPYGMLFSYLPSIKGAAEAVRMAKAAGKTIVIFSSRFSKSWIKAEPAKAVSLGAQMKYVHEVLTRDGIPYDYMTADKGPAEAYFDDKAVYVKPNTANALYQAMVDHLEDAA